MRSKLSDQPKNTDSKSKLMIAAGAILLSLNLAACNALPNQKPEPKPITQEQLNQTILFANKYPEIFNSAIYSGAKIVPKTDGMELHFESPPATVIEDLIKLLKEKGLNYQIGYEFLEPNNLSDRGATVIKIKNKVPESNSRESNQAPKTGPNNSPL